jgi:hypothetical protein
MMCLMNCYGLIHILNTLNTLNTHTLSFSVYVCILICDFSGHCIVVVSKLPITKNTHVYGSANAGRTVKSMTFLNFILLWTIKQYSLTFALSLSFSAENFEMEKMLKAVTQKLNLKPHFVLSPHTHTFTLTHSHTHTLTYTHTLSL